MPPFCPTPSVFHPLTSSSTSSPFRPLLSHSHPRPFSLGPLSAASAGLAAAFFASSFDADDLPLTGSCGIAKIRTPSEPAAHVLPQPESAGLLGQAGEDAFFIASNGCAWGVADGVGGWSGYPGADSALYSRTLMRYALNKATEGQATLASSSPPSVTPLAILESAYASTQQHSIIGSTTACIVVYDPQAQLIHYANLGDSGLLIIRAPTTASSQPSKSRKSPAAFEKSEDRQHGFNCPFQLGHRSEDRPKDAAVAALDVRDGDLMILATDGFFDNLSSEEVMAICSEYREQPAAADEAVLASPPSSPSSSASASAAPLDGLARLLCSHAHAAARDPKRDTPFSRYCRRWGKRFDGGKMDDISVVVVQFRAKKQIEDTKAATERRSKL